jgi:hypothetical protein
MFGKDNSINRRELIVKSLYVAAGSLLPTPLFNTTAASERAAGALPAYLPVMDRMPARPNEQPLNWRTIAEAFDSYVMNPANGILIKRKDGSLCFASANESNMDGGLTTFAPVVLGKALRGEEVCAFLPSLAEYFNERAGIFLDGVDSQSTEYWYMMNINALAAALTRKALPRDTISIERIRRSTDRLINLAHQIAYDFNEQGYNFTKNSPWTNKDIYRQPDAVAGYSYIMLFAYEMFGEAKYLSESQTALLRYLSPRKNPWYEVPSGAMACLAAARLSAHHHDPDADFRKALGFLLDPDIDCLKTGEWGGREVNGLMGGFSTEPPGQAYSMESMVILPYLLPALRYDPRYATDIGRYAVNVAANMRLFYTDYLPHEKQSKPGLAPAVPYERLSAELNSHSPHAAGDYAGQRSIYGGAYALWISELVHPTEDPFILQLDLAKTDFLAKATHPSYLYYNPWTEERGVTLKIDSGKSDIYDLQAHRYLHESVEGPVRLSIPAQGSRVLVVIPVGQKRTSTNGVLSVGGVPVDYQVHSRT